MKAYLAPLLIRDNITSYCSAAWLRAQARSRSVCNDLLASGQKAQDVAVHVSNRELPAPWLVDRWFLNVYTSSPKFLAEFVHPFPNVQVEIATRGRIAWWRPLLEANPNSARMSTVSGRYPSVGWRVAVLEVNVETQDIAIPIERLSDVYHHQYCLRTVQTVLVCHLMCFQGVRPIWLSLSSAAALC